MKLNIVMVEPEIPQNTGNIARTCAAIGAKLHLVYPLGFSISEKAVKRAGLDYWDKVEIEKHESFEKFLEKYKPEENNIFFATTKGKHVYSGGRHPSPYQAGSCGRDRKRPAGHCDPRLYRAYGGAAHRGDVADDERDRLFYAAGGYVRPRPQRRRIPQAHAV